MKNKKVLFWIISIMVIIISVTSLFNKTSMSTATIASTPDVELSKLSKEMSLVRDYVPPFAIMAHRGTTFWAPEETESAFRWARETGADYLECDLQVSKDGVILSLHDDDLKRTTNIETLFGENIPKERLEYYKQIGYTNEEAQIKFDEDKKNFKPYMANFYTYQELLLLDAGSWFNIKNPNQARTKFSEIKQYISTLEDLVMFSKGKCLKRDPSNGERLYKIIGKTGETINSISGISDKVNYEFQYSKDSFWTSKNIPGIYIEFKNPSINPEGFEQMVYDELDRLNMNIITKSESLSTPFYTEGRVNVGNTNGKVILQTFYPESLERIAQIFQGKIPVCFLLWKNHKDSLAEDIPSIYSRLINMAIDKKAHIFGPSIKQLDAEDTELNNPHLSSLIRKSGLLNHPYSFDSKEQMDNYFEGLGFESYVATFKPPYLDGVFTNRTEMSLQYLIDKGVRDKASPQKVIAPQTLLTQMGY